MALQGKFRQDLYYRLNVMNIYMPPLRERTSDLILLAEHFATQTARRYGLPIPNFTDAAKRTIQTYTWPGNVRELRHQVSRAILLCYNHVVTEADLALPIYRVSDNAASEDNQQSALDAAEKAILLQALAEARNNVSEAARKLGITRMTMRYRMDKHQIKH
jgi:DNA-binding NtrC family response regulator